MDQSIAVFGYRPLAYFPEWSFSVWATNAQDKELVVLGKFHKVLDKLHRAGIGPVHVVEGKYQRPFGTDSLDPFAKCNKDALLQQLRIGLRDLLGHYLGQAQAK